MTRALVLGLVLLTFPCIAISGPNAGGVLVIHADTTVVYTNDISDYCSTPQVVGCHEVLAEVPSASTIVYLLRAYAVFADAVSPRLKAVSFGVDYDPDQLILAAHGPCFDFVVPSGGWPAPNGSVALSRSDLGTSAIQELYWFAAYTYTDTTSTVFELQPAPDSNDGFVDDGMPPLLDPIMGYGILGFGRTGVIPCPTGVAEAGTIKALVH
jgi:hypothetical protein